MCIRDRVRIVEIHEAQAMRGGDAPQHVGAHPRRVIGLAEGCLLYTSDAADERSSVDLGGRRIIKKKKTTQIRQTSVSRQTHETR